MEHEKSQKRFESVYSTKVRAGKRRTYFFDVRRTKGDDYYITLTESTRRFNGDGYERHKIFLYKEDFNRFLSSLEEAINHVKTELMPDYDYDEFTKRQLEWEARRAEEAAAAEKAASEESSEESPEEPSEPAESEPAQEETVDDTSENDDTSSADDIVEESGVEESPAAVKESDTSDIDEEEDMTW